MTNEFEDLYNSIFSDGTNHSEKKIDSSPRLSSHADEEVDKVLREVSMVDFKITESPKNSLREETRRGPKRKYDRAKAAETRERRKKLRDAGIDPGSHYTPRNQAKGKRKWVASGRYRGANLPKGGGLRQFKDNTPYTRESSIFINRFLKKSQLTTESLSMLQAEDDLPSPKIKKKSVPI